MLLTILVILVLFGFLGGGGYYWSRPGWRFGGPDLVGVLIVVLLLIALLRLLGV